jgi:predicted ATPase/class 3 adenylate cyclase
VVEQPTGTVTLLFSDIEGSTRLLRGLGRERYAEALELHRQLLRGAFGRYGGYEVDCEGDAFFVAFARAEDAVAAAAEAQQALAMAEWPEEGEIRVRMGLHTGEPLAVPPKYVGLDVHQAARIMAAAHGGQVLLSETTRGLLDDGVIARDLGDHQLKDFASSQRLYQLLLDGVQSDFPPLRTPRERPTNLPAPATPLVGRVRELSDAAALLGREEVRIVTFTGPGGTGKTRLALQVAAEVSDAYPDGVWWVALASLEDPALFFVALAQALDMREQSGRGLRDSVLDGLAERRSLVLLDNVEQLLPAVAADVALLRDRAPATQLLVTSRERLRLSGEHAYPVPPLAASEGVALFVARAAAAGAPLEPSEEVGALCERLDNLPLALELAAARAPVLPPGALLRRLDGQGAALSAGARDVDDRQRTLEQTIDWSYRLLDASEQRLFCRLAGLPGGARLEAAEALLAVAPAIEADLLELLQSLVDKSLLRQRVDPDGEPRFWMLATIRDFARARLEQLGEAGATLETLARHLLSVVEDAHPRLYGPEQAGLVGRLRADHDNIRLALDHFAATDAEALLRMAGALGHFWWLVGSLSEGLEWEMRALGRGQAAAPALRVPVLDIGSVLAQQVGELHQSEELAQEGLRLCEELDDDVALGRALSNVAAVATGPSRLIEAKEALERSIEILRRTDGTWSLAISLLNLGDTCRRLGGAELPRAVEYVRQAHALYVRCGDALFQAYALLHLAQALLELGRNDEAVAVGLEALVDARGYPAVESLLAETLARVVAQRDARLAARLLGFGASLRHRHALGRDAEDQRSLEAVSDILRRALGDEPFEDCWSEGAELSFDDLTAALRAAAQLAAGTP